MGQGGVLSVVMRALICRLVAALPVIPPDMTVGFR